MKNPGEFLISPAGGAEILMGNTAIVRAMIETGVRVVTSYPGSPTPEIAEAIRSIEKEKRPFYFEFSVNEKVATEVAFGASVNGHLTCVFFKSVGLNVASDTFVQLGLLGTPGGMIIVLGDDPGANSSQNGQDNRHYARMAYIPVLEPGTPTEVYKMFKEGVDLSVRFQIPVILRLTTHVCHGKEKVFFDSFEAKVFDNTPRFDVKNGPYIPITSAVFPMKRKLLSKIAEIQNLIETSLLNKIDDNKNNSRGVITHGLPYYSLLDVLEEAKEKPDILKLGTVYPLPKKLIVDFLSRHKEVKILEELDDILEKEIKAFAYDNNLNTKIIGKKDIEEWMGEYTPDKVYEILRNTWPDILSEKAKGKKSEVPLRPAQMCPGCGHRSAFHAIKAALREGDITVGDIGCHTLGFLPPYNIGEVLICMGHSNGTASGLTLFNEKRRVISFLGDSTFYHAGLPGIINSLFNKHNHTLIIMENGTTAMTGHQDNPVSGKNFNEITDKIPIRKVLEGLGVKSIREVDTYQQDKLTEAVKEALEEDSFNVVIAKHPCMLKLSGQLRKSGKSLPPSVRINEKCNKSHICVKVFACPAYQLEDDGTVWVHEDLCIGDGSCKQVCPVGAIVQGKRGEH